MDQQNYAQFPTENQQQPQWQPQPDAQQQQGLPAQFQQQPNGAIHQPQQMPPPGTPIPMMPNQSTPQLNSMYSQESLPAHAQAQQGGFAQPYQQQPQMHFPDEQMPTQQQQQQQFYPDVASMSGYGGAHPSVTPSEYDFATASQQPQQQQQQQQYQEQQYQQQHFTPQPAATAWEQQNVYEVNPQQAPPQTPLPHQPQPQPTDRSLELTQARQRISALEAAREQQDTQLALQISAQEAGGQLAEREEREVHETLLRSLDSYERDLRRGLDGEDYGGFGGERAEGAGRGDWYADVEDVYEENFPDADAFEGMSATATTEVGIATTTSRPANRNRNNNFPLDSPTSTPIPMTTNPALHPAPTPLPPIHPRIPSQVASLSNTSIFPPPIISSPSPSPTPTPSSSRPPHPQQQNDPVEQSWTSPTPHPCTPTPATAPSSAARNREDEEARRWRAFRAQQQARLEAGSVRTDEISSLGVEGLLGGSESTVGRRKGKGKERARD